MIIYNYLIIQLCDYLESYGLYVEYSNSIFYNHLSCLYFLFRYYSVLPPSPTLMYSILLYSTTLYLFLLISDLFVLVSSSSLLFSVPFPPIFFCILFFSPIFCSPMMIETIRCQSSEFHWRKLIIHKLRAIFTENNEIYIY